MFIRLLFFFPTVPAEYSFLLYLFLIIFIKLSKILQNYLVYIQIKFSLSSLLDVNIVIMSNDTFFTVCYIHRYCKIHLEIMLTLWYNYT